jgi:hypothetical protein
MHQITICLVVLVFFVCKRCCDSFAVLSDVRSALLSGRIDARQRSPITRRLGHALHSANPQAPLDDHDSTALPEQQGLRLSKAENELKQSIEAGKVS